ncbi:MAG: nicotinamide-nucleotide amidohydrolase family protein [Oscillospiraceae bacterium]|nr:nicotinamide-nucleotide amidohydrolase family protein [Oscillospiraceae bacterium]
MNIPCIVLPEYGKNSKVMQESLDKSVSDVVKLLLEQGRTISTCESLTGGLLSERITSVAGASQVFALGVCTYSDAMKHQQLSVSLKTLRDYGAVSRETAVEMAKGLTSLSHADLCISVTGLAGPGGGSPDIPVGTVYAGFASGNQVAATLLRLWELPELDRNGIRHMTANCVFQIAKQILLA